VLVFCTAKKRISLEVNKATKSIVENAKSDVGSLQAPSASLDRLEAVLESLVASTDKSAKLLWISLLYLLLRLLIKINAVKWTFHGQFVAPW
jgi:hypothetical protein